MVKKSSMKGCPRWKGVMRLARVKRARSLPLPSVTNCGRQVALEALALGCAVIASDVPCLRDLITDGVTGLLTPRGDVVQLARQTRTLLVDPSLRQRLGDAARMHVRREMPLERAVATWRDVYRSVA